MFIIGLIGLALRVLEVLILVRVVFSFVPQWGRNPFGQIVIAITEPLLAPLRAVARVGGSGMALDFSPMIALIIIHIVRAVLHV